MTEPEGEKKLGRRGIGRGTRATATPAAPTSRGTPEPAPASSSQPERPPRGRGRARAVATPVVGEEGLGVATEEGSPDSGSPKGQGSPGGSDVEEKMKDLAVATYARRPGFGVVGHNIKVLANYFEFLMKKEMHVLQYRIEITHGQLKLNRDDKRLIFFKCITEHPAIFGSVFRIAYDGDQICICLEKFKFGGHAPVFHVPIRLLRMEREENMKVTFEETGSVTVNINDVRMTGLDGAQRYTTPLQILDILFRQYRSYPLDENIRKKWFSSRSTGFKIPLPGNAIALSLGRVIWQGLFGATRIGQGFIPYINFNVTHSGFYKENSVLQFLIDALNAKYPRVPQKFVLEQLTAGTTLQQDWVYAFKNAIRGVKIRAMTRLQNGTEFEREHIVYDVLLEGHAENTRFPMRTPEGEERLISVAEYFSEKYGPLRYPLLNLLDVGKPARRDANRRVIPRKPVYLPIEHCKISPNQRIRKLNKDETARMITVAAVPPKARKDKIFELINECDFSNDPWLRNFGVDLKLEMKTVNARILPPLKIRYAMQSGMQEGRNKIEVNDGIWNMRNQKFLIGGECKIVGALILDTHVDPNMYMSFFNSLFQMCNELGMRVPSTVHQSNIFVLPPDQLSKIEERMTQLKQAEVDLVIATYPEKSTPIYSEIKRVADVVLGIMSQCVVRKNVQKKDPSTLRNLALKMNAKMGGVNSEVEANELARRVLKPDNEATLVLGIDVTHPAPGERNMPSIASVVGNDDDTFMRYFASIRVQRTRTEPVITGNLMELVRECLFAYFQRVSEENKKNGTKKPTKPSKIVIFRDGVSETQFEEILKKEVPGIRKAWHDLDSDKAYRPKLTFMVTQKRHHTRFFPTAQGPFSGKAGNICPGTVVDKDITHPEMFEFYLCSHHGIQGTSRPIRYHVLVDENNLTADHIQAVAFNLCHAYGRCTRAVSIPAPVYFADLACRRARAHVFHLVSDFAVDTMSEASSSRYSAVSETQLIACSTVHDGLKFQMYFT